MSDRPGRLPSPDFHEKCRLDHPVGTPCWEGVEPERANRCAEEGRSLSSPGAWPVRICCGDGTVWDEMPDDLDHAFALIEDYDKTCGCERPGEHYVEQTQPATWERVSTPARTSS